MFKNILNKSELKKLETEAFTIKFSVLLQIM